MPVSELLARWSSRELAELVAFMTLENQQAHEPKEQTPDDILEIIDSLGNC